MNDALAWWYTNSDMRVINRCRLYLQVECLSEIRTATTSAYIPGSKHNH
jgi:hypothetical protein